MRLQGSRQVSIRRSKNEKPNNERLAGAGNHSQLFSNVGGGEPPLVCRRGRAVPRLLLGINAGMSQGRTVKWKSKEYQRKRLLTLKR